MDLAKAMQFSLGDISSVRKGILPIASFQPLMLKVIRPMIKAFAVILVPWLTAAYLLSPSHKIPEGLGTIFSMFGNMPDFVEEHGLFRTIILIKSLLVSAGLSVFWFMKVPLDLVRDVLGKRVKWAEGRVTTREEDKKIRGKRDEVSFYYFHLKEKQFQVSRKAYLAIDEGGSYRVYFLPRSQTLIAIEPAILAKEAEEKELHAQGQAAAGLI